MDVKLKRNIVLVGHAHCGKTSLTESLLFASGATSRKGDVMAGNSLSDFNDDEKERTISINASYFNFTYNNHEIHLIDAPGYMDFVGDTVSSLRAADAAVVVVDATSGVEVGTEDVWGRLDILGMPRLIFINKSEKDNANVDETIKSIREQLSKKAVKVDLDCSDLIEAVAETDDVLLEKYLNDGELSKEEVEVALKKAVIEGKIFPILTGSALKDQGVKELLDAIVSDLPSPVERRPFVSKDSTEEEVKEILPSEEGPFAGFIFKSLFDPHLGHISLMRVVKGSVGGNTDLYNTRVGGKEHISGISVLNGKEQSFIPQATCGDIVALTKLKHAHVSDTLCDAKDKIAVRPILFPEPSISASIKPKTRADEEKISTALHRLCEEDHTFQSQRNEETHELIVSGIGDLHLKVLLERMKSRYHVEVEMGRPKVSYREAITKPARARHKYKKQSGGKGQYGDVELAIEPLPRDGETDYEFVNKIFGGAIPKNFIPSIEKGVQRTLKEGVLAGYPLNYVKTSVVDGSYHDVDSSDMAFQLASWMAMKEAIKAANPVLLEPIMEATIVIPDEFIGNISGDISSKRGRMMGSEARGKNQVLKAHVPLAEMFTYTSDLRSITGGRGSYSMKTSHYEQAPQKITEQVIARRQQEKEAVHA